MPNQKINFPANQPVELALAYSEGKEVPSHFPPGSAVKTGGKEQCSRMIKPIDPKYGMVIRLNAAGEPEPFIVKIATGEAIPEDEPLILFRARDHNAIPGALVPYFKKCLDDGCTDFHMAGISNRIQAFENFRREHGDRMKQPGITGGL
jgi:hypothetical protein